MAFVMKVQGLDRLQRIFTRLPKQVQTDLDDELQDTANEIEVAAKKEAPKDEVRLANSISSKKEGILKYGVVAQTAYAGYLEFGTKSKYRPQPGLDAVASSLKGATGSSGNPLEAIEKWVKRKGIAGIYSVKTRKLSRSRESLANIKQVARRIWFSIWKYGIRAQPFFFKHVAPAEQRLKSRFANVIKKYL